MSEIQNEKHELTRQICEAVSIALNEYSSKHPDSKLSVEDVRQILLKIIDYLDIADITEFGPWK